MLEEQNRPFLGDLGGDFVELKMWNQKGGENLFIRGDFELDVGGTK